MKSILLQDLLSTIKEIHSSITADSTQPPETDPKKFPFSLITILLPTSALGVHQASMVLKYVVKAASQGLAVILITHNVHHAYPVGNSFTVLNRGKSLGTFNKKDISREELLGMMAGGEELDKLEVELEEMNRINN